MTRADALAAYEALPLPDTTEEHWRFTNLRGFDPVTADGIEIERVPEGVTFEPLPEEHERLYSLVGWDEKFAAHNAALWKHGLLVHVPKGIELEKPLYVRIAASTDNAALFWRLLVIADPGARFTLVE